MNIMYVSTNSEISNGASKCYVDVLSGLVSDDINIVSAINGKGILNNVVSSYVSRIYNVKECVWVWESNKDIKINLIKIIKYLIRKLQNLKSVNKYIKILKENNIDIVYINAVTEYCAALAAKKTNTPLVWHIREMFEEDLQAKFVNEKFSINLLEYASTQICISNAVENKFKTRYGLTKTKTIYDGVDIEKFYYERKLFISDKIKIYIFGRLVETKGQLLFLHAVNKLKTSFDNLDCKMIGLDLNDDFSNDLKKYISENKLQNIVEITGFKDNPEELMREADIVCICSDAEGFGLVTVESMLSGALVIGSNSGCTPELIGDDEYGLLYEYKNADDLSIKLKYAIENKNIASQIAKKGQLNARKYSVENNVKQIEQVLKEAVYDK